MFLHPEKTFKEPLRRTDTKPQRKPVIKPRVHIPRLVSGDHIGSHGGNDHNLVFWLAYNTSHLWEKLIFKHLEAAACVCCLYPQSVFLRS